MRLLFFSFLLPSFGFAKNTIEVTFEGVAQKVIVKVGESPCLADGERADMFEILIDMNLSKRSD